MWNLIHLFIFLFVYPTEVEWSGWSECSVSCGTGIQTRHLQCVNPIGKTRPCPILETDHVEQRPCKVEWCKMKSKYIKNHKKKMLHKTRDFFPNTYSVNKGKFTVFKKHHIHKGEFCYIFHYNCMQILRIQC